MKDSTHMMIRGIEDIEIEYEYSEDWQSGFCTGCEVEWKFARPDELPFVAADLTEEEDGAIVGRIIEIETDPHRHDYDLERD